MSSAAQGLAKEQLRQAKTTIPIFTDPRQPLFLFFLFFLFFFFFKDLEFCTEYPTSRAAFR